MSVMSKSNTKNIQMTDITCSNSILSDNDDDDDLNEDFIDDDSNDRSNESIDNCSNRKNKKKTLGRVKIKMAYIDNKIRRYTTFSKRKTGIMKKAYELATLTGTEVMLLVASETGHVYTYATPKLQPMITSEAGKALIQTCLAKDESMIESPPPITTTPMTTATILSNNDVIFVDENQCKKRDLSVEDGQTNDASPTKRSKQQTNDEIKRLNKSTSCSTLLPSLCPTTTLAVPLSCLVNPQSQQQAISNSNTFTIDINSLKANGMNMILTTSPNPTQASSSSNIPLVLALGSIPYQPP